MGEVMLLFATNTKEAKKLSSLLNKNEVRRIHRGIYTDNLQDPISKIVRSHWMEIVSYIVSEGILSYRTAIDLKPAPLRKELEIVFMTSTYTKTITLPGLVIKVYKGNSKDYTEQILPNLARSNTPRMLLENLIVVKSKNDELKNIKTVNEEGVERYLVRELQVYGENGEKRLNQIRDEAKQIAEVLDYQTEYNKLNQKIASLLSTNDALSLKTPYAKAVAKKEPYDEQRLNAFQNLSLYLQKCIFRERPYHFSTRSFKNLSFFESYFSNFIEGTEFLIEEAEDIVFKGIEIYHRHADSHDVLANFHLTNDFDEMSRTPRDALEFLTILKARHAYIMKERPEKIPGEFKEKPNRAGNTYFVDPKNVIGTLTQGFEIYRLLKKGLPSALFMHYLVSEVHPFNDGNGRIARIMMNSELVQAGLFKMMMPTVCRDNYLGGLRRATRDNTFHTYCKVLDQAQAYTESVPWEHYGDARKKIESDYANQLPDDGLPIFNRTSRLLALSDLI